MARIASPPPLTEISNCNSFLCDIPFTQSVYKPDTLLSSIITAVSDSIGNREVVAVAYSGGLDSSLVADVARQKADIRCYTACTASSYDHAHAAIFAEEQGLHTTITTLTDDEVLAMARLAAGILRKTDAVEISYTIPLLTVLVRASEDLVLTGSVADELFGGYAKYAASSDAEDGMRVDLEKALSEYNLMREYAKKCNKILASPFADPRTIKAADTIPFERKIGLAGRKLALRELAQAAGLSCHDRPKKASQYSSGVMKAIQRLAREDGTTLAEWTENLSKRETS